MSMKHVALKIGVAAVRLAYVPVRGRSKKNQITILSRQSRQESTDISMLRQYLVENHPDVKCNVMIHFIEEGFSGKIRYMLHMLSQMKAIAESEVVVLDGYCIPACVLKHSEKTRIVQMWHALSAIKEFGYQTLDKPSGHDSRTAEILCMHRNYDHIICAGRETGKHFCKGFNAHEKKLVYLGLPRIDMIVKKEPELKETIRKAHGIEEDREIVLYVPTFRKNEGVRLEEIVSAIDPEKQVLAVKFHPLYNEKTPDIINGIRVISESTFTSYEWLKVCDRIITDYSAIGVEASLLDKPLYFFVYDIDEYKKNVGLNINPEDEMTHVSARTGEQLAQIMAEEYDFEKLAGFRERYVSVDTENCTGKLGDYLYGMVKENN